MIDARAATEPLLMAMHRALTAAVAGLVDGSPIAQYEALQGAATALRGAIEAHEEQVAAGLYDEPDELAELAAAEHLADLGHDREAELAYAEWHRAQWARHS